MKDLRQIIRESILLAENLQQADKVYFTTGILSSEVRRYVVHITQGDAFTKIISDIVYAELQQYEKQGEFLDDEIFSEKKPRKKKTKAINGIYNVSKITLTIDYWKEIRVLHNNLLAYNKNVFPIKGFNINGLENPFEFKWDLKNRQTIIEKIKELPSIAIRNMKEDIRKERNG